MYTVCIECVGSSHSGAVSTERTPVGGRLHDHGGGVGFKSFSQKNIAPNVTTPLVHRR